MAEDTPKRAERLVSFRKLQRERASMDLHNAKVAKETAESAVEAQKALIEQASETAQSESQVPLSALDMQLSLAMVEALREDLSRKYELLKNADNTLKQKADALILTHQKVKQMEALKAHLDAEASKSEKRKNQAEIDDMATNRGARK